MIEDLKRFPKHKPEFPAPIYISRNCLHNILFVFIFMLFERRFMLI